MTKLQSALYLLLGVVILGIALGVTSAAKEHALYVCEQNHTKKACEEWLEGDGL